MNIAYNILALIPLAIGIVGIIFVTIPSVYAIGEAAEAGIEGELESGQVVGAVIGGFLLWLSTGFFIVMLILGVGGQIAGFVAD